MLSLHTIKSAKDAAHYYEKDDYYTKNDPEHKKYSEWYGKGAKALELSGQVDKDEFVKLLEGKLPDGKRLGRREGEQIIHACGIDLTFSAPKSVSILSELKKDKKIGEIHDKAVSKVIDYIEKAGLVKIRNKVDGKIVREAVHNLAVSFFRHNTSRSGDPHKHIHVVVQNMAMNAKGEWRSVDFKEIFENKMLLGLMYRVELAYGLSKAGYTIHQKEKGMFEVAGVPQELIDLFSKRSRDIKEALKEYDFKNAKTKALLAKVTRESKKQIDRHEFFKWWEEQCQEKKAEFLKETLEGLKELGRIDQSKLDKVNQNKGGVFDYLGERWKEFCSIFESNPDKSVERVKEDTKSEIPPAEQALLWATKHLTERSAVFTDKDLMLNAFESGLSKLDIEQVLSAKEKFIANGALLKSKHGVDESSVLISDLKKNNIDKRWKATLKDSSKRWGEKKYISWFSKLKFEEAKNKILYLKAPSEFIKSEIEKHYLKGLKKITKKHFKDLSEIRILSPNETLRNVRAKEKQENLISKEVENKFSKWRKKLTASERNKINPYERLLDKKLSKGILKAYFKNEILIPQLIKQGKIKPLAITKNKKLSKSIPDNTQHIDPVKTFENTYTTKEALTQEKETIALMKSGFKTQKPIYTKKQLQKHLKKTTLNKGQRDAVSLILNTKDRIVGIQGHAGTGKTFMLKEARKLLTRKKYKCIGLATSSRAASVLQKDTRIKSQTIHSFLCNYQDLLLGQKSTLEWKEQNQSALKNTILLLDEAGQAPTNQVNGLFKIAKELNIRVVPIGDRKQLGAVEAGKPVTQLQKSGMKTAIMDKVVRQTNNTLKDAVYSTIEAVDRKDTHYIKKAIEKIGNNVHEVKIEKQGDREPSKEEILQGLIKEGADKWLSLSKKIRKETLIVTPSHDIRSATNDIIVKCLCSEGVIKGHREDFNTLRSTNLTEAEQTKAYKYKIGDQVLFFRNYKSLGVKKGEYYTVEQTNQHNKVQLRSVTNDDFICWFNPSKVRKGALEVFENDWNIGLQKGALIRWTKNSAIHSEIKNSESAQILDVTNKHIKLKLHSGKIKIFCKNDDVFKHMSFAYCSTVHAAQGTTSKYVIGVIQSDHKHLTNQRLFYVEISRGKEKAFLITDSLEKLLTNLSQITGAKLSSLEHQNKLPLDKSGGSFAYLTNNSALNSNWSRVMQDVIKKYGEITYLSWFSKLEFASRQKDTVNLQTQSALVKEFLE
ncbi:MAG: conjugative relaxase [Rickettsiales bacterium]|nr:conjugative relaxase [Rickettsiales bacterium]